jgi:predicted negative regulator of RcsB-dependent stress response
VEPGFEATVHAFWTENRNLVLLACAAALLAIVGREGWQYFSALREKGVQEDYAAVADKPEKLATFAEEHAGHALAGVASLRLADQKFETADYKQAAAFYTKAAVSLKNDVLLGRARLGAAVSQINSGDKAAGEAGLKAVGADQSLLKTVRAEAIYHLASLAADAGKTDEVKKLVEEVGKIDLGGAWSQRAVVLLSRLPAGETGAPSITFKTGGN